MWIWETSAVVPKKPEGMNSGLEIQAHPPSSLFIYFEVVIDSCKFCRVQFRWVLPQRHCEGQARSGRVLWHTFQLSERHSLHFNDNTVMIWRDWLSRLIDCLVYCAVRDVQHPRSSGRTGTGHADQPWGHGHWWHGSENQPGGTQQAVSFPLLEIALSAAASSKFVVPPPPHPMPFTGMCVLSSFMDFCEVKILISHKHLKKLKNQYEKSEKK